MRAARWITAQVGGRPGSTLALLGVLVVVGVLVGGASAWQRGLERAANAGIDPSLTYLIARGSEESVERSVIEASAYSQAQMMLGGASHAAELVHMGLLGAPGSTTTWPVTWRGIDPATPSVRQLAELAAGTWPEPGSPQVVLGDRIASEAGLTVGDRISLLDHELTVSGLLDGGVGFAGTEAWLSRQTLSAITGRDDVSLVVVRDGAQSVGFVVLSMPHLGMVDIAESAYLGRAAAALQPLRQLGWLIAGLLLISAVAGAWTTAIALSDQRSRQLATVRSLGHGPWRISGWLLGEYLVLALLAGGVVLLALQQLDGQVLRLGNIAPALHIDAAIWAISSLAVVATAVLLAMPSVWRLLRVRLALQLK